MLGYVYAIPSEETTFTRADTCEGVRHDIEQNMLILHSPSHWVAVPLPTAGGTMKFWYRWGSDKAHIGPDEYPVSWGRIAKG